MSIERNPQAAQMADESMVRNLAAQAAVIWPQEAALFARYAAPAHAKIVDVGCGSGEISARLAQLYPAATVLGIDVLEGPLAHARRKHAALAPRLRFQQGDAFQLDLPGGEFDVVVCRHVTQAVPEPERVLAELLRICKPGGWLHILSEDYMMLHLASGGLDTDRLWKEAVPRLARATGVDERIGRRTWGILHGLGVVELSVDYVVVDTLRAPRDTFAEIIRAWRDGYAGALEEHGEFGDGEVQALFDSAIAGILDPHQYSVWHVPIVSGRKPLDGATR